MPAKVIKWDLDAWEDYLYWQTQDKKTLKRINQLVKDIARNPFDGIGKPEPFAVIITIKAKAPQSEGSFLFFPLDIVNILSIS